MKKYLTTIVLALLAAVLGAVEAAPAVPDVEFDFTKSINSTDGKIVMKGFAQKHEVTAEGLKVFEGTGIHPAGIRSDKIYPELNPKGDFEIQITFKLDAEKLANMPKKALMVLLDNKSIFWPPANSTGAAHTGYGVVLTKRGEKFWAPTLYLGMGSKSATAVGSTANVADGKFHTLTVKFATNGKVVIIIDGRVNYTGKVPAGTVAPAANLMAIGDRAGASYWGIEGVISSVKFFFPELQALTIDKVGRRAFERTEKNPVLSLKLGNHTLQDAEVPITSQIGGGEAQKQTVKIGSHAEARVDFPVPERLRPGKYDFKVSAVGPDGKIVEYASFFTVAAEENPEAMPVVMWQDGDAAKIAAIGFTAQLRVMCSKFDNLANGDVQECIDMMDTDLENNLRSIDVMLTLRCPAYDKFWRLDSLGKRYKRKNYNVSDPELIKLASQSMENAARAYGSHPALAMVLINSEIRDGSQVAYNGHEAANYKKFANADFPVMNSNNRQPENANAIPDFPVLGNIDPEMPSYKFFRWWWKNGDGWNPFHRALWAGYSRGLGERADQVIGFYDPVVRTPPIAGSAAGVPMVNQWSYSYPSPLKLATATDEMRAMARLNGGQKLMKTTQAIWYRDPPAPKNKKVANPPAWVKEWPDAAYITIAPDCLTESLWSKISRRLDAIAYHGYGSLVEVDKRGWNSYRLTNTQSREVLKDLIDTVIRPLGPMLKTVPEKPIECAVLYTAGTNLFSRSGSWGWGWGSDANMHQVLQRAQLDPAVIFDEDIYNGILKDVKVLAMPNCSILDKRVIDAVHEFQLKGGIVIGGEGLNALILPDVSIAIDQENADDVKRAANLRKSMGKLYNPYSWSDSNEVATHVRAWKDTDYLFVVNDTRKFGDYLGMYGNVKETGIPHQCTVSLRRNDIKAVYDPVRSMEVPFRVKDGRTYMDIDFQTNDGRLYIAMKQKIAQVKVSAPANAVLSDGFELEVEILDENNQVIEAVLPLQLTVTAADQKQVAGSGYYQVTDGRKTIKVLPSCNDAAGQWQVQVKELASGKTADTALTVQ